MALLHAGDVVDRFRVERIVGRGGQATVYQVRHVDLGVVRALKVLEGADAVTQARLLAEGRVMAQLRHPSVVEVFDVLRVEGAPALVMEFVGGGTLHQMLVQRPLSDAEVGRVFRAVLDGVGAAHASRIVHRDLKPANVLMDDSREPPAPKVADFGIARDEDAGPGLTRTQTGLGTPSFMAPEQARNARDVDARADIWSLGAMLYVMLTREVPFHGGVWWEVIQAAERGAYTPISDRRAGVPEAWEHAVRVCLRRDPAMRPPDVATLRAVFDGEPWQPGRAVPPVPETGGPAWRTEGEAVDGPDGGTGTGPMAGPTGVGLWTEDRLTTPLELLPDVAMDAPGAQSAAFGADAELRSGGPLFAPEVASTPGAAPKPAVASKPSAISTPEAPPVPVVARASDLQAPLGPGTLGVVLDDAGVGHVVEVVVSLHPGAGEVTTPMDAARDAIIAAQVAIAAALGPEASRTRAVWQVRGADFRLHGTSLGLALAMAVRARGRPIPRTWAFAAGVDLDGRLAAVAGMPAKLRAAASAGCAHVAVSVGSDGPGAVPFARLEDVERRIFVQRMAWPPLLAAGVSALSVAAGLTLPIDAMVHYPLLRAAGRAVEITDVVVVALPSTADLRGLRPMYPELIRTLTDAGARAILFDVTLAAPTPDDAAIAEAVRASPIPVILPILVEGDAVRTPGTPELASAVRLGQAVSWADLQVGWIRRAQLQVHDREGRSYWHVATLAAAALGGADTPVLDGSTLQVGAFRNPVSRGSFALAPAGEVPVVEPTALGDLRGRVAIVGAVRGDQDLRRTPDGPRYGAEVLAVEIQTIVRQAAPREAGALIDLAATVATAIAALRLPWGRALALPLVILIPLVLALAYGGTLLSLAGPLLAWTAVVIVRVRYDGRRRS